MAMFPGWCKRVTVCTVLAVGCGPLVLQALNLDQLVHHRGGGQYHHRPYDTQFSPLEPLVYGEDEIVSELQEMLDGASSSQKISKSTLHPREVIGWSPEQKLGQVSGITVDNEGRPVLLHRGARIWEQGSFNNSHHFQGGLALDEDVVLVLDEGTGHVVDSWGRGLFLMPHGITIDVHGNTWITDVAKHQVFKFSSGGRSEPSLTLGVSGEPGTDEHHFCQPASVAVATSGEFFVADGYCNSRLLKFSPDGELIGTFGSSQGSESSPTSLSVPHGLALDESRDTLCIADREHSRVICIRAGLNNNAYFQQPVLTLQEPQRGRVFDVAAINGILVGVAGSQMEGGARGFTGSLDNGELLDVWKPIEGFSNPHAITVSPDGSAIYVAEIGPNRVWKFVLELSYY